MRSVLSRSAPRQLLLAAAMLALVSAVGCKKKGKTDTPPDSNPQIVNPAGSTGDGGGGGGKTDGTNPTPSAPAGWQEARDTVAGYRLLVPGRPVFHANYQRPNLDKMQATSTSHGMKGRDTDIFVRTVTYIPPAGTKMGTTPDELYAAFQVSHKNFETFNKILEKKSVTLGGTPALLLITKPIDITAGAKLPDDPEFARDILERRKKSEAQRTRYYVTTHGPRVVLLEIIAPSEPPAEFVKTVTDSFAFQ